MATGVQGRTNDNREERGGGVDGRGPTRGRHGRGRWCGSSGRHAARPRRGSGPACAAGRGGGAALAGPRGRPPSEPKM
jgi:hypothetical protein